MTATRVRWLWALCELFLAARVLYAGEAAERGRVQAVMVPQGPKIDGTLSDPIWQKAPRLVLGNVTGPGTPALKTTAAVLFDDRFLYIALDCDEPDTDSLKKDVSLRDGPIWEDDCVEVFVSADPELGYRHIGVNAGGVVMDASCRGDEKDRGWNAHVQAKVTIEKDKRWTATIAVPLKELDAYVGRNLRWRLNVTRSRAARGDAPVQEWSWAMLPTTSFHQPDAFGLLSGVNIAERADGVTRKRAQPVAVEEPAQPDAGTQAGDVTVYYKLSFDSDTGGFEPGDNCKIELSDDAVAGKAMRVRRIAAGGTFGATLPVKIAGSADLRIAYHCKASGVPEAGINVYDQVAMDNTTSKASRWLAEDRWTPILYYLDAFRYNAQSINSIVRSQTFYRDIRFHGEKSGAANSWMLVDNFVVYRGNDRTPPGRVEGLKAEPGDAGVRLSWKPAEDNVAVMLYAISRGTGDGPFQKIAESTTASFTDSPGPGQHRYRVLACDFEENRGEWSDAVSCRCEGQGRAAEKSVEQAEREGYADRIIQIARKGAGKVNRNIVVCYGDSLTGATVYPLSAQAGIGTKRIAGYGYESQQTSFGKARATEVLARDNPYLMLVLFGTNNPKDPQSIPKAMDDLVAIAETAAERGTIVVLGAIPPRGFTDPDSKPEAAYNKALVETCRKSMIPCGHLFEEYQKHPNRRDLIADDGVHNTAAGMAASARAWKRVVEQVHFALGDGPTGQPAPKGAEAPPELVPKGETARLKATADIWLSDANDQERNSSAGLGTQLKIKTIQEMAAIRFDVSAANGREVLAAKLFLRRAGSDMLRYIRVSTVNGDWEEGRGTQPYGPGDGATYTCADYATKRPWAWPGSEFCDVVMSSGNSVACWAERKEHNDGWVSVDIPPQLVYALVAGDTDGLAVMDGGNLAYHNNFIHSAQSKGSEPYIEVTLGGPVVAVPAQPAVKAEPAPERAHIGTGAIKVTIEQAKDAFCWRLTVDGKPVERWRVKHPEPNGPTVFYVEDLPPSKTLQLAVVAVAPGGQVSPAAKLAVSSSPALGAGVALGQFSKPPQGATPPTQEGKLRVWACPGLVKISPERPEAMFGDVGGEGDPRGSNAVWDGRKIRLFGARGEYVSYQLCIEKLGTAPLAGIKVRPAELRGPNDAIVPGSSIELFRNWYAKNRGNRWQPAYCIPMEHGAPFRIPDPQRNLPDQQNQTLYVDVYIPRDARPGSYSGTVTIEADGVPAIALPVDLTVLDLAIPDRLSFWPELNAYNIPRHAHAGYRLAHQHRCVLNCWRWAPGLRGSGKDIEVIWDDYDRNVGPLLTGKAFEGNRRAGMPVECMYLPFEDSWPTPLSKANYNYQGHWPGRGEDRKFITEHYLKAPYIADALSQDYKDAFLAVQRQFIQHFKQKGYTQTEMQCFYGGKNTHRIDWGSNMWWTTDEPYHWDDWLALQFFCRLWTQGRGAADRQQWAARADISRPQWQGRVLAGIVDTVYFGAGAFGSPAVYRRCLTLEQETGLKLMTYGSANPDNESNTQSVVWLLNAWLNGANGALPWQTLGDDKALDVNDAAAGGGNALIVSGDRFGLEAVGDMRLKALRDGQQLVEYLAILAERRGLQREQVRAMVQAALQLQAGTRPGAGADNADALQFGTLQAWQLSELRRCVADLIVR